MAIKVGDFFLALGFDVDAKPMRAFDEGVVNLKNNLFGAKEYAAAAGYALARFANGAAQAAADMGSFTDQTGLSATELQKWQSVAEQINRNLTSESVTAGFKSLSTNMNRAFRFGEGNINAFARLGINTAGTVQEALEHLREIQSDFDPQTFSNLISDIGLNPEWISLLKVGNAEFEKLSKNIHLDDAQLESLDALGSKFKQVTIDLEQFKNEMAAEFSPDIIKTIDIVVERLKLLHDQYQELGEFKAAVWSIAAGFAAWTAPITLTIGAITGLIVSMQELVKFFHGEENMFSDLEKYLEKNLGWQEAAKGFLEPGNENNILNRLKRSEQQSRRQIESAQDWNTRRTNGAPQEPQTNSANNTVINNKFDIKSTASPLGVAQDVMQQFQNTLPQINKGNVN